MGQNATERGKSAGPDMLIDLRDGIYADDFVIAAVAWLDLFTRLSGNPSAPEEIAASLGLAERPLDVLLTLLTALGLVERRDGRFVTTALSEEYLVGGRPKDLGPFFASQKDRPPCVDLYEVLKSGEPAGWSGREDAKDWESLMAEDLFAGGFTAAMDSRGAVLAPAMARAIPCEGYSRILDVAGGSGVYACAVVEEHPHMRAAVLEKPPVDEVARAMIAEKGFSDRVEVIGSDMFASALPRGFDVHLWSHVLHDWSEDEVRLLLSRSFESLDPGGMVVIHDAHINAEKTGPLAVARFSVLLMHSTRGKCYSVREIGGYLEDCGFIELGYADTTGNRSIITAVKPPSSAGNMPNALHR
ncbi:MAG: methyltransferase [Actinomycetota bacterium]